LSRVLREPAFGAPPRLVAFGPDQGLPEAVQSLVGAAAAEAYDRGRRDGIEQGAAATAAHAAALARPVAEAIERGIEQLLFLRDAEHAELLELAAAIARAVTAGEPTAAGQRLLQDVAAALDALDDAPLAVMVNPRDVQLLADGLTGRPGVSVVADAMLEPGAVLVRGPWAVAEVTRDALWSAVAEALGLGETPTRVLGAPLAGGVQTAPKDSAN
jgi:flagellar biosynthesis/type III secretory pathway protein FliH